MFWRSSEKSIRDSVRSSMTIASNKQYASLAMPLIGAGSGGGKAEKVLEIIRGELNQIEFGGKVVIVKYSKQVR